MSVIDVFVKAGCVAAALGLVLGLTAGFAVADAPVVKASNGVQVTTPDLDAMDCAQMGVVLMKISASGYRGPDPVPEGHPDRALFEYENQLAAIHYLQCQVGRSHYRDSQSAFSQGFE